VTRIQVGDATAKPSERADFVRREFRTLKVKVGDENLISAAEGHGPVHALDFNRRDHRKLLVVDGARAFTGGVNLARQWAPVEAGGDGWRDDMIEVVGETASELRTFFFGTWRRLTAQRNPPDLVPIPRTPRRRISVLSSRNRRHRIHREYVRRIRRAKHSVDIANPYFVPDFRVMRALDLGHGRRGLGKQLGRQNAVGFKTRKNSPS